MKRFRSFIRQCLRECPFRLRCSILAMSVLLDYLLPFTAGTTEADWAGVRPSSGAAASDPPSTLETSKTPLLADVAAPEDGRTPVVRPRCAHHHCRSVFVVDATPTSRRCFTRPL